MELESSSIPPGFRFHPTEEELVGYYLTRKINSLTIDLNVIADLDLYKMEAWDIEDRCKMGYEEQSEWYFFSHKDKKYPTGTRTNRATAAGFWKATGRDKAVVSGNKLIGMRKTLVFYSGRAPNGRKTDWIVHEYRLQSSETAPPQDEGWVVCRAFKKPSLNQKPGYDAWNHPYYPRDQKPGYEAWNHPYHPRDLPSSSIRNPWRQPPLSPLITDSAKQLGHTQAGETSANHQPHVNDGTILLDHELFSDHRLQLTEVLPQLDSPLSVAYHDEDYYDNGGGRNINKESGSMGEFFDWKNLDSMAPHSNNMNVTTSGGSSNNSCFLGFFLDS